MADTFIIPKSIEELYEQYGMKDTKEIYTNGTEFIPVFRLIQFIKMNGYDVPIKKGDKRCTPTIDIVRCEVCKYWSLEKELTRLNGERYTVGYCCLEDKYSDCDWFCADGERKPALKHADKETLQSAT